MKNSTLTITHLGSFAHKILQRGTKGIVTGISSRGIFLQPEDDLTLFLSREKFRGPLTINLGGDLSSLQNIQAQTPINFKPSVINFPDENLTLNLPQMSPQDPGLPAGSNKLTTARIAEISKMIPIPAGGNEFLPLIEMASTGKTKPLPGVPGFSDKLDLVLNTGKIFQIYLQAESLANLLGLGPGLTPLGDDFILGVLLTLNRWGHLLSPDLAGFQTGDSLSHPNQTLKTLNQDILEQAWDKTTRLSASLLTCAAAGAADDRLLKVLDSFFLEVNLAQEDLNNLLQWGNSSGIAVLAGMYSCFRLKL